MDNQVVINGMQWGKVESIIPPPPLKYDDFADALVASLRRPKGEFRSEAAFAGKAMINKATFSFDFPHGPDPWNPLEVGWALVLPPRSKETESIAAALEPLVLQRKGQVIYSPISFSSCSPESWIHDNYDPMDSSNRPYYVLLAGSVQDIPFRFQYNFDVSAAVGRLSLNTIEDYRSYAKKVVQFETHDELSVARRAVVFATEHNVTEDNGATWLSRHLMAEKIINEIEGKEILVEKFLGDDKDREATLDNLLQEVPKKTDGLFPALVYTATHGVGVTGADEETRRKMQGAIVCQDYNGTGGVFCADKVPEDPFLHGSIVLTFACYSAGTPNQSDFFHWLHDPRLLTCQPSVDFVAALPIKMLAHPQGPLAFLGHIGPSFGLTIADPRKILSSKECGPRVVPFRDAADWVLKGSTIGYAVNPINTTYAKLSVSLASIEDDFMASGSKSQDSEWKGELVNKWVARNDMQNFIVLGDPAVRAKMK